MTQIDGKAVERCYLWSDEYACGTWVRASDYNALSAHAEKMERENEALRGEKAGAKSVANEQFHRANRLERERDEALAAFTARGQDIVTVGLELNKALRERDDLQEHVSVLQTDVSVLRSQLVQARGPRVKVTVSAKSVVDHGR